MTYRTLGILAAALATGSGAVSAACDTSLVNLLGNGTAVLKTNCGAGVTVKSVDWKRALNGAPAQSLTGVVALTPNVTSTDIYYRTPIMSGTATYTVDGVDSSDVPIAAGTGATFTTLQPTLTVATTLGGTISSSPTGINSCTFSGGTCVAPYSAGTFVSLTATPSSGYTFAGWGGDCSIDGNTCGVTIMGPQQVTASFTANPSGFCPVTAPTPSQPTPTCVTGTPSSVTPSTADFRWTCTSGSSTATCIAPRQYAVTSTAGSNGTVNPPSLNVTYGKPATFTVTPSPGYVAVRGGTCPAGTLVGTTYTTGVITGTCSVDFTFQLAPVQYTVTATAGSGGTVTPSSRTVNQGATTTFTVTPNTGYAASIAGSCPSGSLSGTTYTTGAITGACSVDVTFSLLQYTVNATAGSNGTIAPNSRTVSYGSTTTFTVTPDSGYTATASGCGGTLSGTTYTTGAITSACTVNATFNLTTGCGALPSGYTLVPANSTVLGDLWNPNSTADTLVFTVGANEGVALEFTMSSAFLTEHANGFQPRYEGTGLNKLTISTCPGRLDLPVLGQNGTVDANSDGKMDNCALLGTVARYNNNASGSDNYYTPITPDSASCYLPTHSGGTPATYYINLYNNTTISKTPQFKLDVVAP